MFDNAKNVRMLSVDVNKANHEIVSVDQMKANFENENAEDQMTKVIPRESDIVDKPRQWISRQPKVAPSKYTPGTLKRHNYVKNKCPSRIPGRKVTFAI